MRACLKYLKDNNKCVEISAEIGVHCGVNAMEMLKELPIQLLYLIDPYKPYVDKDSSCLQWFVYDSDTVDNYKAAAKANINLNNQNKRTRFIELPSLEAIDLFPAESFNFVYIDASHSRPNIDSDIFAWYPKVKVGGVLGGHDWGIQDVQDAVHAFAKENNITLQEELFETDWFIQK
jgi:hypothetical protein